MCDQEVDAAGLDVAALADPDGAEHGHQDEGDGAKDDPGRLLDPCLGHDPAGAEKDDDAEDVDEAGGEDAVPGAEEHALRDQEVGQPPGRGARSLQKSK